MYVKSKEGVLRNFTLNSEADIAFYKRFLQVVLCENKRNDAKLVQSKQKSQQNAEHFSLGEKHFRFQVKI